MHRLVVLLAVAGCGRIWFDPIGEGTPGGDGGTGDGPGTGGDGAPIAANIVFVTASDVVPGALGGLAGADARCQQDADAAGLTGDYVAWLSTTTTSAIDRLAGSRGWVRPDGIPFVDTVAELAMGTGRVPISVLADGTDIVMDPAREVVTATADDGTLDTTAGNCTDWTSTAGTVYGGSVQSTGRWTFDFFMTALSCATPYRLYCFGVGRDVAPQPPPVVGRRAFLSTSPATSGGGLAAFDAVCQGDANAAALGGTWVAFIGTMTAPPAARLDPAGARWVRLDGVPLAPTAADVLTTGFHVPLNLNTAGVYRDVFADIVWTGATSATTSAAETCLSWTTVNASMNGGVGTSVYAGDRAFGDNPERCDASRVVYCLEQ